MLTGSAWSVQHSSIFFKFNLFLLFWWYLTASSLLNRYVIAVFEFARSDVVGLIQATFFSIEHVSPINKHDVSDNPVQVAFLLAIARSVSTMINQSIFYAFEYTLVWCYSLLENNGRHEMEACFIYFIGRLQFTSLFWTFVGRVFS